MAKNYKTPGVYVEEIQSFPRSVAQVGTAIPAFIGYTEKANDNVIGDLKTVPKRISSLLEYKELFGSAKPESTIKIEILDELDNIGFKRSIQAKQPSHREPFLMYYALQMFYANGGGPCYIVSVGRYGEELDANDTRVISVINSNDLVDGLNEIRKIDEPTLLVFPDATALNSDTEFYSLYNLALQQCSDLRDRFTIIDTRSCGTQSSTDDNITNLRNEISSDVSLLKYGAAYYPFLETILDYVIDESKTEVNWQKKHVNAVIESNVVALDTLKVSEDTLYNKIKSEIFNLPVIIPPSATLAGIYARVDSDRGVWKAPANVGLTNVIKPTVEITNQGQEGLNIDTIAGKSINAIRSFTGRGNLVWGARTLAGNDNEWRYISVRRFFNMVEESVKKATEQFVFEPNDANTWVRIRSMISNFLTLQWRDGALQGTKPEHAFYVNVGLGETMTAQDILEGNLIVEIGMAPVRPAEFIILRFSQRMQEA